MRKRRIFLAARVFAVAASTLMIGCDYMFSSEPISLPPPDFQAVLVGSAGTIDEDLHIGVHINRDGSVWVKGEQPTYEQLVQRLLVFSERKRDMEHPAQPSEVWLALFPDRRAPWAATRRSLWAAADADVRIYKIRFLVVHEQVGRIGWMSAWLPHSGFEGGDRPAYRTPDETFTRIEIRSEVDPEALYAAIRGDPDRPAVIYGADDAPTGEVLRAYDLLLRAGRKYVLLSEKPPDSPGREPVFVDGEPPPAGVPVPDPPSFRTRDGKRVGWEGYSLEGALPPLGQRPR